MGLSSWASPAHGPHGLPAGSEERSSVLNYNVCVLPSGAGAFAGEQDSGTHGSPARGGQSGDRVRGACSSEPGKALPQPQLCKGASDFPASDSEQREATFGFISSSDFLFCFYAQWRGERFLFRESFSLLGENKENHFHSNMLFF